MKYYDREHREVESAPLLKNAIKEWCKRNNFEIKDNIANDKEKDNKDSNDDDENR